MTTLTAETLATLAHDIRNTLNVVLGGARLLAADNEDNLAIETAESAAGLALIIDRLVDCAKRESSEDAFGPAVDISLKTIIDSAIRRARRDYGLTMTDEITVDPEQLVTTHPAQAELVIADVLGQFVLEQQLPELVVDGDGIITIHDSQRAAPHCFPLSDSAKASLVALAEANARFSGIEWHRNATTQRSYTVRFNPNPSADMH